MTYTMEIGPVGSPNLTLDGSDIVSVDIAKPHTALADYDIEVPYSRSLRDRVLERVRIYGPDGSILFRGYLKEIDWDQQRGVTRVNGPGIGDDLRDTAIERSFTNIATHAAIEDVWNNNTAFNATVRPPDVSVVVENDILVDADTTTELDAEIDTIPTTAPVIANNGEIQLAQTLFLGKDTFGTGERADTWPSGEIIDSDGNVTVGYLGGQFGNSGDTLDFSFNLDYTIPSEDLMAAARIYPFDQNSDGDTLELPQMEFWIDGTKISGFVDRWGIGSNVDVPYWFDAFGDDAGDLAAGSHTFSIVQTKDSDDTYDEIWIGLMAVYDDRFSYNFDNTVSTTGTGDTGDYNYLEGPELGPNGYALNGDQLETDFNVVGATVSTTGWNDTTGEQQVAVSIDGGQSYATADNATSVDVDDLSNVAATVDWRVTLDRYGSGQQRTPNQGYLLQSFDAITVDYDGSDLSIIQDDTFRGSPLRILTDLHQRADYRFVIDHAATDGSGNLTKSVESFERGSEVRPKDWTVINRKPSRSFVKYANEVTIYGELQADGTRPKVTVQDDDEVQTWGREPYAEVRPDLKTVDQVRAAAIDTLGSRVKERDQKGTIQALPTDILPGYSYPVDWFADGQETNTPMERVTFSEGADSLRASLKFVRDPGVTESVIAQGFDIARTREGI